MSPLQSSQSKLLVIAVAALAVAAFMMFRPRPKPDLSIGDQYFYDLGAADLYIVKAGVEAPTVAPSGKEGVAAAVFGCGGCDNPADRFVAYLTKSSDAYIKAQQSGQPMPDELARNGTLYRAVGGGEWMVRDSPAVMKMIADAQGRCPGAKPLTACMP